MELGFGAYRTMRMIGTVLVHIVASIISRVCSVLVAAYGLEFTLKLSGAAPLGFRSDLQLPSSATFVGSQLSPNME